MFKISTFIALILQILLVKSKKGFGPGEQDWGFADVSNGGHMFYWLYYAETGVGNYTERPLVVWLQGGPGVPGSFYSNFYFIGPLDEDLNHRNGTFTENVNVLFIDNPVGAGFSYVDFFGKFSETNNEIALNLVELMKIFYERHPEFVDIPVHIFGESFGGQFAAEFALEFYKTQFGGNVKSVSLINSLISSPDAWSESANAAYYFGIIDEPQWKSLSEKLTTLTENSNYFTYVAEESLFCSFSQGVSKFNVDYEVKAIGKVFCGVEYLIPIKANGLMNGDVKQSLNLTNYFWKFAFPGYFSLRNDLYKPTIHIVNQLLNSTNVNVNVLSGSLDLVAPTAGTLKWIRKLDWNSKSDYVDSPRNAFFVNGILQGYEKIGKGLSMFWIHKAGHWIARDNFVALNYVLKKTANLN